MRRLGKILNLSGKFLNLKMWLVILVSVGLLIELNEIVSVPITGAPDVTVN